MVSGQFLLHFHIFGKNDEKSLIPIHPFPKGKKSFLYKISSKTSLRILSFLEHRGECCLGCVLKTIYLSPLTAPLTFFLVGGTAALLGSKWDCLGLLSSANSMPVPDKASFSILPAPLCTWWVGTPCGAGAFLATLISPFHRWGNGTLPQMSIWLGRNLAWLFSCPWRGFSVSLGILIWALSIPYSQIRSQYRPLVLLLHHWEISHLLFASQPNLSLILFSVNTDNDLSRSPVTYFLLTLKVTIQFLPWADTTDPP